MGPPLRRGGPGLGNAGNSVIVGCCYQGMGGVLVLQKQQWPLVGVALLRLLPALAVQSSFQWTPPVSEDLSVPETRRV